MKFIDSIKSLAKSVTGGRYTLYKSLGAFDDARSQRQLLRYNDISLYLNRGIDKRAEKVSEVQFVLKDKKGNIIERNPFIDLLNRPNKNHTGKQFWKLYQKHLDITGNAFIRMKTSSELWNLKKVDSLELLRPDLVEIKFNADESEITGYVYKPVKGAAEELSVDEVIYSFDPDPKNPLRGASILRAGIRAIETEVQLSEYHAKVLQNGGKPETVFTFKSALTKKQLIEAKESYIEQYGGAEKAGVPLFLGGDGDVKRLGLNPDELSYLQTKGVTFSDICILTGVPEPILSLRDAKFDNADAATTIFLRETINPLLTNLVALLDWRFVPEEYDLEFIDPTPENQDKTIARVKASYETDSSSINERREMLGLEVLSDPKADEIFVSFNKTPLNESEEKEDKSDTKKKSFNHPLKDNEFRQMYGKVQIKRLNKRQTLFLNGIKEYFEGQEERLVSKLTEIKRFKKKGLFDEIFDKRLEISMATGFAIPLLRRILSESGHDASDLMDSGHGFNMTGQLESWLGNRAELFADEITETTYKKLTREFTDSFENGETRQQLVKRIKDTYAGFYKSRAETIARTETHGAMQKGTIEGYRQSGSPIKIWVWAEGVRGGVRDDHASIDGQEKPIDMPFVLPDGTTCDFPGDTGDPSHDVNCECSV